eukprot:3062134-Amphidinium_carterae.5
MLCSESQQAGGHLDTSSGGARVNGNLNLSRSLGDLEYKKNQELGPEDPMTLTHRVGRFFDTHTHTHRQRSRSSQPRLTFSSRSSLQKMSSSC